MPKDKGAAALPLVVGIGSSAGGLEAIRELASSLPMNNGCAYVIVQHMSPQHKSLMTSLIASETKLRVQDITDETVPERDVIYVTPPRADVIMENGKLRLVAPSEDIGKPKPSVDRFLISLARDRGDRSMGIILSGTGSDGAYGIQALREVGGITIAQDEESAKYDGMPNAAIETGCIDLVLGPAEIATHLNKILSSPRNLDQFRTAQGEVSPISDVLRIVLARTRVDFREYKQSTVLRRIDRRMTVLGLSTVEDYVVYCRNEPPEVDALFKDLLISVTRFFRDREEFEKLEPQIQELVDHSNNRPLRIWVAGCATGEEVYSIAIMLAEAMGGAAELVRSKTQIFATDIDRAALDYARRGTYSQGSLLDVPKDLADKYFIQQAERVRVIEALRSVIQFSDHNLCQDPPFLNMDLICCRNLLIYFSAKLQVKVFARLHYAMKQGSYLFLGTAESVTGSDQLFVEVAGNPHIFRKRELRRKDRVTQKAFPSKWVPAPPRQTAPAQSREPQGSPSERIMFDALARSLGENSILVSSEYNFLRVYGDITPYVNLTEDSTLSLQLSLLKPPFREEARSLVTLALKHDERRMGSKHRMIEDNGRMVRLEALPIQAPAIDDQLALVVINSWSKEEYEKLGIEPSDLRLNMPDDQLRDLDQELANAREALQQTIQQLETSNEELQALSEELQSTNEELQATNEELETSNEELQSTNEELITVNEELQVNSSELMGLNAELGSLLGNVPIPLLVLDNALQVARASNAAMQLFNIAPPLRNPHLSQIHLPEGFPKLVEISNEALQLGSPVTRDFETSGGPFTLQCAPFTGNGGQIIGTTLVFLQSPATQSLANELHQLLNNAPIYMLQHDETGDVTRVSKRMAELLGINQGEAIGTPVSKVLSQAKVGDENGLRQLLDGEPTDGAIQLQHPNGGTVWLAAMRHAYTDPATGRVIVVIVGNDVTEIIEATKDADQRTKSLEMMQEMSDTGYWRVDLKSNSVHWSERVYEIHGRNSADYQPTLEDGINHYHEDDRDTVRQALETSIEDLKPFEFRCRLLREDGDVIWVRSMGAPTIDNSGKVGALVGSFRDISAEFSTQKHLHEVEAIINEGDIGFFSFDVLTGDAYWSASTYRVLRVDTQTPGSFELVHKMVDPADQDRFAAARQDTVENGTPFVEDFKATLGNGDKAVITINMSATKRDDGQVTDYYGTLTVNDSKDT
ncbi:MAG: chemotaxis protein CheB [Pseudomonadota bacterium]